jgi:hypothetical protein
MIAAGGGAAYAEGGGWMGLRILERAYCGVYVAAEVRSGYYIKRGSPYGAGPNMDDNTPNWMNDNIKW